MRFIIQQKVKSNPNGIGTLDKENITEREKIIKLEAQVRALKKDNDELLNAKFGIKKGDPVQISIFL